MTKEDFENSEHFEACKFVGVNVHHMVTKIKDGGRKIAFTIGESEYDPLVFLQLLVLYHTTNCDYIKDPSKKIVYLWESRSDVVHLAENSKRIAKGLPQCEQYHFDGFANQYDSMIQIYLAEIQNNLLNSQIETNKSTIQTNKISKTTNMLIAAFTFAAAIWYIRDFVKSILLDYFPRDAAHLDKLSDNAAIGLDVFSLFILLVGAIFVQRIFQVLQHSKKKVIST